MGFLYLLVLDVGKDGLQGREVRWRFKDPFSEEGKNSIYGETGGKISLK